MSGIQTNFRAEDMIGAAKPEVVIAKPAPALKGTKAAKVTSTPAPAPVVEEPAAVVEEVVVAEEPVVEG